jgi:hypothetical protein
MGAVGFATTADAVRVEYPLAGVTEIASGEQETRILLDPGDLTGLEGRLITSARLEVTLSGETPGEDLDVAVYTVVTAWRGTSPGWSSPWQTPGGDLDNSHVQTVRVPAGRTPGKVSVDVTSALREIADRKEANNGFLLTIPLGRGGGFSPDDLEVLGSVTAGRLLVTYQEIAGQGHRSGSLSVLDR